VRPFLATCIISDSPSSHLNDIEIRELVLAYLVIVVWFVFAVGLCVPAAIATVADPTGWSPSPPPLSSSSRSE
jgi:hypothetical protein